jgi:hypothetical protein
MITAWFSGICVPLIFAEKSAPLKEIIVGSSKKIAGAGKCISITASSVLLPTKMFAIVAAYLSIAPPGLIPNCW